MLSFSEKILELADRLHAASIPYAIGGALALGYYAPEPRATQDIDVNIFLPSTAIDRTVEALSPHISISEAKRDEALTDDQVRLFWDDVPVDLFFEDMPLHAAMAGRIVDESFAGHALPILSVTDVVICKAIFNRDKDWVDIGSVLAHPNLDVAEVRYWVENICGESSEQSTRWKITASRDCNSETERPYPNMLRISEALSEPDGSSITRRRDQPS